MNEQTQSHRFQQSRPRPVSATGSDRSGRLRAIREGQREPAQRSLWLYRLTLEFQKEWSGNWYAVQQVVPVVAEEADRFVVITVYTYYF
jgi:hypothetical protein